MASSGRSSSGIADGSSANAEEADVEPSMAPTLYLAPGVMLTVNEKDGRRLEVDWDMI